MLNAASVTGDPMATPIATKYKGVGRHSIRTTCSVLNILTAEKVSPPFKGLVSMMTVEAQTSHHALIVVSPILMIRKV